MTNTAVEVLNLIKKSKRPVINMDSRADFDAVCSTIILHRYIAKVLDESVDVYFDGILPDSLKEVVAEYADIGFITENTCPLDINLSKYDLQIFLDSGSMGHICKDDKYTPTSGVTKLNIDHHAGNTLYGDYNYVKHYASCCSVLFYLFREGGVSVDESLATIYYLGLLTDSGFFQYNTVTSEDFQMAAELLKMDAKYYEVIWKLTFNEKAADMRLKGLVYSNLVIEPDLKVGYSTISLKELNERAINLDQTVLPPADNIKRLEGVDFVFVIRESATDKGLFNVSFRSHKAGFDVLRIAKHFDGGGHVMAAGASVRAKDMKQALEMIFSYLAIDIT